jgi:hypothetical protein
MKSFAILSYAGLCLAGKTFHILATNPKTGPFVLSAFRDTGSNGTDGVMLLRASSRDVSTGTPFSISGSTLTTQFIGTKSADTVFFQAPSGHSEDGSIMAVSANVPVDSLSNFAVSSSGVVSVNGAEQNFYGCRAPNGTALASQGWFIMYSTTLLNDAPASIGSCMKIQLVTDEEHTSQSSIVPTSSEGPSTTTVTSCSSSTGPVTTTVCPDCTTTTTKVCPTCPVTTVTTKTATGTATGRPTITPSSNGNKASLSGLAAVALVAGLAL